MLTHFLARMAKPRACSCGHSRALHFLGFGHCLALGCKCKEFSG